MAKETVNVDKSAVHIDQSGHIIIRDPKAINLLKTKGIQFPGDLSQTGLWVQIEITAGN